MSYSEFISTNLKAAAYIALANFGKVTGTTKPENNNQVLTETDLEIGHLLVGSIQKAFPDHNIIDEEAGVIDKASNYTWVVDPIDGTSNFASGVVTYGIYLGLLENDTPIAGGMALPAVNELYIAEKGNGTTCNGKPVHVTKEERLLSTLVAYHIDGYQDNPEITIKEMEIMGRIVLGIRNMRSSNSAFDIGQVVHGRYGAVLNQTGKIWDNVAAQVIVEEAGGVYTDYFGKPHDYSNALARSEENFSYCAGSPSLHAQIQKLVHQ